jgi:hypothetical protein
METILTLRKATARLIPFLLLIAAWQVPLHGQTPILITGTQFEPLVPDATKTYYGHTEVMSYGLQPTRLEVSVPITPDADPGTFLSGMQYGITNNPFELANDRFLNDPNGYRLVISNPAEFTNPKYAGYSVNGLAPGSVVTMLIEYCSPTDHTTHMHCNVGTDLGFKVRYSNTPSNSDDDASPKPKMGECGSITITGRATANGSFSADIHANSAGPCASIAFSKIEIRGIPAPEIFTPSGSVACLNEFTVIQSKLKYEADYNWQMQSGGAWIDVSSQEVLNHEVTALGTYRFRLQLKNGTTVISTSNVLELEGKECCPGGASRQIVFLDDFGRFALDEDPLGYIYYKWNYSDILNPVEEKLSTIDRYRYPLATGPIGHTYKSTGAPGDGSYTVAGHISYFLPGTNTAHMEWGSRIGGVIADLNFDRSGTKEGAALFINLGPNTLGNVIYSTTISNLCVGKNIDFEAWINVFTDGIDGVDVKVELTDVADPNNKISFNQNAEKGGGWKPITGSLNMTGSSLRFELTNNSAAFQNGNDLVIDDIKVMTCSSPKLELFFDAALTNRIASGCTGDVLNFYSLKSADAFSTFFSNNARYLLQWTTTPTVIASWKNIGTPGTAEDILANTFTSSADFAGLADGGRVFFRMVAASPALFTSTGNFQNVGSYANANDPCKSYSVSNAVRLTKVCPLCTKPILDDLSLTNITDNILCPGGTTVISPVTSAITQADAAYQYYKSATAAYTAADAIGAAQTASTGIDPQAYSGPGFYTLRMWDSNFPAETSCTVVEQIEIKLADVPEFSFSADTEACQGDATVPGIDITFTGETDFSFELETVFTPEGGTPAPAVTASLTSAALTYSITPPSSAAAGVYTYKLTALSDKNCDAEAAMLLQQASITINSTPVMTSVPIDAFCAGDAARDISTNFAVTGVAVPAITFEAGANINATGTFTPPASGVIAQTITVKALYTAANSCSAELEADVLINPLPVASFNLDNWYCKEATIDLGAAVSPVATAPATGTFSVTPALVISGTNTVDAGNFSPFIDYVFTYSYTDANGCKSADVTASTYAIHVPAITSIVEVDVSGVKTPTHTGTISAALDAPAVAAVPASRLVTTMNWIDNLSNELTAESGSLSLERTHPAGTFVYKAYQTIETCKGEVKDVRFMVSACDAETPEAIDDFFCATDNPKTITATPVGSITQLAWHNDAAHFTSNPAYGAAGQTTGNSYTLINSTPAEYIMYVASYDASNTCWSSARPVKFTVKAEPVPTITVPAGSATTCYSDATAKNITLSPALGNADFTVQNFTINNTTSSVASYIPSSYAATADATINFSYSVTEIIGTTATGVQRTCASLAPATAAATVQFVAAPTVSSEELAISAFPYKALEATGAAGNTFRWYEASGAITHVATGAAYDVTKGVDYSNSATDVEIDIWATQLNPNGCESAKATGKLSLIRCPHSAPGLNSIPDICLADIGSIGSLSISAASQALHSATGVFHWKESNGNTATGTSFTPTVLTEGTHTVEAWVNDINVAPDRCNSATATVTYTVKPMPDPNVAIPKTDLCIYDAAISLQGRDGSSNVTSGTFNLSGNTVMGGTASFLPASFAAGPHTINFEYTLNGCTATSTDYTITVHEVPVVPIPAVTLPLIPDLPGAAGSKSHNITASPTAAGLEVNWFTSNPLNQAGGTSVFTGNTYNYVLSPQPVIPADGSFVTFNYTVYAKQKMTAAPGCFSMPSSVSFTATNCPVPTPTGLDVAVCLGEPVANLTAASGTNWGSAIPDNGVTFEKRVGTGSWISTPALTHSVTNPSGEVTVQFRTVSPTMYGCTSPALTLKVTTHQADAPNERGGLTKASCFLNPREHKFEIFPDAKYQIHWYSDAAKASELASFRGQSSVPVDATGSSYSIYAANVMVAAPRCTSTVKEFSFSKHPEIPDLTVTDDLDNCMSRIDDKDPSMQFPSLFNSYFVTATNTSADAVTWFSNQAMTRTITGGSMLELEERNDYGINFQYSSPTMLYARAQRTMPNGDICYSQQAEAKIQPKRTPLAPVVSGNTKSDGVYCQGSDADAPIYEISWDDETTQGLFTWYIRDTMRNIIDEPVLDANGNPVLYAREISTGETLDLSPYLDLDGEITFYASETLNGCESEKLELPFTVAPKPQPVFAQDYLRLCADVSGRHVISIDEAYIEEGSTYDWYFSGENNGRDDQWSDHPDGLQYAKIWYNTRPGIDMMVVKETNQYGCDNFASIMLYAAEMVKPTFDYDYYYGVGEIVFANRESENVLSDRVSIPALDIDFDIEDSLYTVYDWTFVHNASQRARTYQQKPVTSDQMQDVNYYIGYGPSVFYDSIKVEEKITPSKITAGAFDTTYVYTSVGKRKYVEGRKVNVWGGVPFEYGASTATLTRSIDGYDDRSCKRTSNEEQLFMKITTGLYIPTVFSPTHNSPLLSSFIPFGHNLESFRMWVFDNWGNTVYYTEGVDDRGYPIGGWKGTDLNGNIMPADSYTWKVDATFQDGNKWEGQAVGEGKKTKTMGNVLLIR